MAGQIFRCDFARQATRRAGILQAHHTRSSGCHSPAESHSDETHHTTHTRPSILTLRFRVSQGTGRFPWPVQHASASLSGGPLAFLTHGLRGLDLGSDRKKRIPLPTQGSLLPLGASMTGVRDSTHPRMWIWIVPSPAGRNSSAFRQIVRGKHPSCESSQRPTCPLIPCSSS